MVCEMEGLEVAARMLFEPVRYAARTSPGEWRVLYFDIEGHRDEQGGHDPDMLEPEKNFVIGFLMRFHSEAHLPLITVRKSSPLLDDIPDGLMIASAE